MLLELEHASPDTIVRKYTWGLDLSQTLAGAGGLLAISDPNDPADPYGNFLVLHDANGNVGQLIAWETGAFGMPGAIWQPGRVAAWYQYDAYGNAESRTRVLSRARVFAPLRAGKDRQSL